MKMNKPFPFIFSVIVLLFPLVASAQLEFQTGQVLTLDTYAAVVRIADLNNDGRNDIVAASGSDSPFQFELWVYHQSASGTFPSHQTYIYSTSTGYDDIHTIDINDVNNDSRKDIVIGFGDTMAILHQNSSGSFNPIVKYYSGPQVEDLKIGDLNNDGLVDIAVAHWVQNYIKVYYQTQSGFTTAVYPTSPGIAELDIADVNADGLNDIVILDQMYSCGVHVFAQNSSGTLNNYVSYFAAVSEDYGSLTSLALADLNNDGAIDMVASRGGNMPWCSIVIWFQDTSTHLFGTGIDIPSYQIPANVDVADFNCDGKPEIFLNHGGWDAVTVWEQDSLGNYTTYDTYPVSVYSHPVPEALASGDINNDGRVDIVTVSDWDNSSIELLYNVTASPTYTQIDTLVTIDTITNYLTSDYYYTITTADTNQNYITIQTDSFLVTDILIFDNIRTDSSLIRQGNLCSFPYFDTITTSYYINLESQDTDTMFWSQTLDSTYFSSINVLKAVHVSISPNPFNEHFSIQHLDNESSTIFLYDLLGNEVLKHTFLNSTTINAEQLPDGIYYYRFSNCTTKSGKIVKL